jgi:hypothetical protein
MIQKPSEFAIHSYASKLYLAQSDDLARVTQDNFFDAYDPCHIYMIGTRPRMSIIKDEFKSIGANLEMGFKIWEREDFKKINLLFQNPFGEKPVTLDSEYPYNLFTLRAGKDEITTKTPTFLSFARAFMKNSDFLDLNVLYIGQSYGVDGARTAPDRLKSHDTLQAIYAEAIRNNPDKEVWLLLLSFRQQGFLLVNGRSKFSDEERDSDEPRINTFVEKMSNGGISEQQFINFTEAALIRYFQPSYNVIYKDSFPNPAHKTYSECYDLDVNLVNVEIGSMDAIGLMLYNTHIDREPINFAEFPLHNLQERRAMFDWDYRIQEQNT